MPLPCLCARQPLTPATSGRFSNVWEMKPRKAFNFSAELVGPDVAPGAAICARFFANLSLSLLSNFCFLFIAPGLDFMLFLLMILTWSAAVEPAASLSEPEPSKSSGNASASESRVVTSFLFGLRLRGFDVDDFVTFDMSCACLMRCLSFLFVAKSESGFATADLDPSFCLRIDFGGWALLPGRGLNGAILSTGQRRVSY